ncbi:MAG TPA: hypothetical protein VN688_21360 [Gemmataceae bacterium]|nr:hypothetical protein [Gemmataceae bacterium]
MRTLIVWTGSVLLLLGGAGLASAQDTARAIIERAVKVHGGAEALARIHADKVKFKGTLVLRGHTVPFVAETTMQLPTQYKHVIETNDGVSKTTIVHIINGDKVYVTINSQPLKLDGAALSEIRTGLEVQRAQRLLPLLQDKSYQLAVLDEIKVNDRPALGVQVTGRGRKELRLYFDKEIGLLVRAEFKLDDGKGKQVRQHYFFGNFKDIGGCKRFTKVKAYRDGKEIMEAELLDAKTFDKIDEAEFAKP